MTHWDWNGSHMLTESLSLYQSGKCTIHEEAEIF